MLVTAENSRIPELGGHKDGEFIPMPEPSKDAQKKKAKKPKHEIDGKDKVKTDIE